MGFQFSIGAQTPATPFVPPPGNLNLMGNNISAGASTTFSFEGMPIWTNRVFEMRGFTTIANAEVFAPLDGNGWPTTDCTMVLSELGSGQPWMYSPANPSFLCGFVGNGTESIVATNGGTISNLVRGSGGAYTTFAFTANNNGTSATTGVLQITITGTTAGFQDFFAYLPAYSAQASQKFQAVPTCTNEWIAAHSGFCGGRDMDMKNAWYDCGQYLPFTTSVIAGATTATLAAPGFPQAAGTYPIVFAKASGFVFDARSITIATTGQTVLLWTGGLGVGAAGCLLPHTSATRKTLLNTKSATANGAIVTGGENFCDDMVITMAIAAGWSEVYLCEPVNVDATFLTALFTSLYAYSQGTGGPNGNQFYTGKFKIAFGNELWNELGSAGMALASLGNLANPAYPNTNPQGPYNSLAPLLHNAANAARAVNAAWFASTVQLVLEIQIGSTNIAKYCLDQYVANGWTPSADLTYLAGAPYMEQSGVTAAMTIAQINAAVLAQTQIQCSIDFCNQMNITAIYYGLKFINYEFGWDSNIFSQLNTPITNLAAAIMDPSHIPVMQNCIPNALDLGGGPIYNFKDGVANNAAGFFGDEWSNSYSAEIVTATRSPRSKALLSFVNNYTPQFNVVSGPGSVIQGYNYKDNFPNTNLPTLGGNNNFFYRTGNYGGGIGNWYGELWVINCTLAGIYNLVALLNTTQAGNAVVDCNVTLGATLSTTAYTIGSGLSQGAVPMGTVPLNLGKNFVGIGYQTAYAGISVYQLEFN